MRALKQSGEGGGEVIIEDDAQKPDIAKPIADKFIQRDEVDILTGIILSNLAMAVVPAAVKDGVFYISPNAGPSQLAGKLCHPHYFNVAWLKDQLHAAMGGCAQDNAYETPPIQTQN